MAKKKLRKGETLGKYIERRIDEIFNDLALEAGAQLAEEYADRPDEIPAGALAFELTKKNHALQEAWSRIVREGKEVKDEKASDPV